MKPGRKPSPSSPAGAPNSAAAKLSKDLAKDQRTQGARRFLLIMAALFAVVAVGPMTLWGMVMSRSAQDRAPWVQYQSFNAEFDCCQSRQPAPQCQQPMAGLRALERRLAARKGGSLLDDVKTGVETLLGTSIYDGTAPSLERVQEELQTCPGFASSSSGQ